MFAGQVRLTVEAEVNGERFQAAVLVDVEAYEDPMVRRITEDKLRHQLVRRILEKYKPAIRVER